MANICFTQIACPVKKLLKMNLTRFSENPGDSVQTFPRIKNNGTNATNQNRACLYLCSE
jgi:hypothetical protein